MLAVDLRVRELDSCSRACRRDRKVARLGFPGSELESKAAYAVALFVGNGNVATVLSVHGK